MPLLPVIGSAADVQVGPGAIYVAPIGTQEPLSASGALDPAFIQVGYTSDGSTFTYTLTAEALEVAELFDPVKWATTKRETGYETALASVNATNLNLAINNGAVTAVAGKAIMPPAVGAELRVRVAHVGQNGSLLSLRQCLCSGAVKIDYKKAPALSTIPITWNIEIPTAVSASLPPGSTGFEPWVYFPSATGQVA